MKHKYTEQQFELNSNTDVSVKTKRKGIDLYIHKITLTHVIATPKPIKLESHDDVAALISDIPLDDDQMQLIDENQTSIPDDGSDE